MDPRGEDHRPRQESSSLGSGSLGRFSAVTLYIRAMYSSSLVRTVRVLPEQPVWCDRLCHQHHASPIMSPSIECFCVIGVNSSTTGQTRWSRTR